MSNAQSVLRSLIAYAFCIPLAIFLGYLLTTPLDRNTFYIFAVIASILCAPFLLRYHHPLMVLGWNMAAYIFFVPGNPQLWMATISLSFGIAFLQRILNKEIQPIRVPELTGPMLSIAVVVLATALLTGGIGTRAFGGDVYGGKRYFYIWLAILGYFALVSQPVARERVVLYLRLFYLGGATAIIGDLFPLFGSKVPYLFLLFPPTGFADMGFFDLSISRFSGAAAGGSLILAYLMARHGIRGIFLAGKPWRIFAFLFFMIISCLGGYRSVLISCLAVFTIQFFLEGMHRTKLMPMSALVITLSAALMISFAEKLPHNIQRSFAFLPVRLDPLVQDSAQGSVDWRLNMWKALMPQVPEHLLLGKGLAMSQEDLGFATQFALRATSADEQGLALSGDYHNGPLSVIIPFGIWGMFAWIWFEIAGFRVLYRNYRYGDPDLRVLNSFLLASFTTRSLMFWLIVGGFYADLIAYTGMLGLSVCINNGVARRALQPIQNDPDVAPIRLAEPKLGRGSASN